VWALAIPRRFPPIRRPEKKIFDRTKMGRLPAENIIENRRTNIACGRHAFSTDV
jgi:hypothetical protein